MEKDIKIAALIPCYNEELTISKVISDVKKYIPGATVYVYDNNSTDNTSEAARKCGAQVRHESRAGKGNVIRTMFREVDADIYIMVDGDDTYDLSEIDLLMEKVTQNTADMAVGDRLSSSYFTVNKRRFHNFGNKLVRYCINSLFSSCIHDPMSGLRVLNRQFVKGFPVLSKGFEIETEMTLHALDKNFKIFEAPVEYSDRMEGSHSKLNTIKDGYKVIKTIITMLKDYRPLFFFSVISLIFTALFLAFFIPVLIGYFKTGEVAKFPTLIATIGIGIFAALSFMCGLILDTIKKYSRQFYEIALNIQNERNNK